MTQNRGRRWIGRDEKGRGGKNWKEARKRDCDGRVEGEERWSRRR